MGLANTLILYNLCMAKCDYFAMKSSLPPPAIIYHSLIHYNYMPEGCAILDTSFYEGRAAVALILDSFVYFLQYMLQDSE